jgi:hypothetical protein
MKKFLKTYLSNDGAGIFALLWIIGIITVIVLLLARGGNKF